MRLGRGPASPAPACAAGAAGGPAGLCKPRALCWPAESGLAPGSSAGGRAAFNPGYGGSRVGDFSLNLAGFAAEDLTRIFEITEIDRAPVAMFQVVPSYPFQLKRAGVEGKVVLRFVVTPEGRVRNVIVVSSSRLEFEKPAIEAAEKWHFEPGVKNGVLVSVRIEQPFIFSVES